MSGDEVFALVVSLVLGFIGWWPWISSVLFMREIASRRGGRILAVIWPLLAAACVSFVLFRWSSHDVRSDPVYIFFYFAMGFGWTGVLLRTFPYLGLNARDDMFERQNVASGLAVGGALLGGTFAFAGGNIGDGPGWWVVVFSAGLATGTLLLMWVIGNQISRVEESLSVDRDLASGWRTMGFFVSSGLILGRAVAGNWHSGSETFHDFVVKGWPALLVWGAAVAMDVMLRPSPSSPSRPLVACGLLPGLFLIAMGLLAALAQGAW